MRKRGREEEEVQAGDSQLMVSPRAPLQLAATFQASHSQGPESSCQRLWMPRVLLSAPCAR